MNEIGRDPGEAERGVRFFELQEAINRVETFSDMMTNLIGEMENASVPEIAKPTAEPNTFCGIYHGAAKKLHATCEDLERKLQEIRQLIF